MHVLTVLLATLFACSAVAAEPSAADAYKRLGPDGVVEFSDTASPGSEPVQISPPSTYTAPRLPRFQSTHRASRATSADPAAQRKLTIAAPQPDQAVVATSGDVDVQVALDPPLRPGEQLRVLVDGQAAASGTETTLALHNVFRGTHRLQVQVIGGDGELVAASPTITFHMIRPSLNLPRR